MITYFTNSGEVVRKATAEVTFPETLNFVEGNFNKDTQYYNNLVSEVEARPTFNLKIIVDGFESTSGVSLGVGDILRVEGIPEGTTVEYAEESLVVSDGFIEWSSLTTGEVRFKFKNFPYIEEEVNANVIPA